MNSGKSYLKKQIRLITITSTDLFTEEEYSVYEGFMKKINMLPDTEEENTTGTTDKQEIHEEKLKLNELIKNNTAKTVIAATEKHT